MKKSQRVVASTVDTEEVVEVAFDVANPLQLLKTVTERFTAGWSPVKMVVTFRKREYPIGAFAPLIAGPTPRRSKHTK